MADLYLGSVNWNEEKVGRTDSSGNVYAVKGSWNETRVRRGDGVPRRAGVDAILMLMR